MVSTGAVVDRRLWGLLEDRQIDDLLVDQPHRRQLRIGRRFSHRRGVCILSGRVIVPEIHRLNRNPFVGPLRWRQGEIVERLAPAHRSQLRHIGEFNLAVPLSIELEELLRSYAWGQVPQRNQRLATLLQEPYFF